MVDDLLKLAAFDEEDLSVVSTFAQDAILKVVDLVYLPDRSRFALAMNRFSWEKAGEGKRKVFERHRAALVFDRVLAVRSSRIERDKPDAVLAILAVQFQAGEPPGGTLEITFAGGGGLQLDVECIEVRLADLGTAWATPHKPWHAVVDQD